MTKFQKGGKTKSTLEKSLQKASEFAKKATTNPRYMVDTASKLAKKAIKKVRGYKKGGIK